MYFQSCVYLSVVGNLCGHLVQFKARQIHYMDTFLCILKAIAGYFILMFAGTNLLGIVVRGLRPTFKKDSDGNLVSIVDTSSSGSVIMTILFSAISIAYFFALYHYWNIGIMTAGLILMFSRLPDLLFEMKNGVKINATNMPKKTIDVVLNILSLLALPLIWYSLCYLK